MYTRTSDPVRRISVADTDPYALSLQGWIRFIVDSRPRDPYLQGRGFVFRRRLYSDPDFKQTGRIRIRISSNRTDSDFKKQVGLGSAFQKTGRTRISKDSSDSDPHFKKRVRFGSGFQKQCWSGSCLKINFQTSKIKLFSRSVWLKEIIKLLYIDFYWVFI